MFDRIKKLEERIEKLEQDSRNLRFSLNRAIDEPHINIYEFPPRPISRFWGSDFAKAHIPIRHLLNALAAHLGLRFEAKKPESDPANWELKPISKSGPPSP